MLSDLTEIFPGSGSACRPTGTALGRPTRPSKCQRLPEIEDEPMPKPQMQVKPDGKDSDVEIIGEVKNVEIIGKVKDPGFSDLFWF